jgi:hypothetical protein
VSNAANFPPSNPVDKPSQYQKGFYPFSAFSADDPNVTNPPTLTLASPWILKGTFSGTGTALVTGVVGTAAALAAANQVLLSGQIGYESDTKLFKIGDGVTAYNSLSYQSKMIPVPDASRTVTPVVSTSTNTAGVWSAAVTMTGVPAGAKAAWCQVINQTSGSRIAVEAATGYTLSDITLINNWLKYAGFNGAVQMAVRIPLDANGQFKWCTGVTSTNIAIGSAYAYEM